MTTRRCGTGQSGDMLLITAIDSVPVSPARAVPSTRPPLRVAAVQTSWHSSSDHHMAVLEEGVALAASVGARIVCLPELTLSPYFAAVGAGPQAIDAVPESLPDGPTLAFTRRVAMQHGMYVQASLWEADTAVAPRGWNTSICVDRAGAVVASTRKLHIPVTEGYTEDLFFPEGDGGFPVVPIDDVAFGFPTCWDQWFPELARAYSLAGAEVLVYPTAIGSEPDHPDFDTQPLWQHVIVGNGITNATFMIAINRIGTEHLPGAPTITFYGSSFISDPYGRILVHAPRSEDAVIVADLDLDARRDWLALFPFLSTRRPDTYASLVAPRPT